MEFALNIPVSTAQSDPEPNADPKAIPSQSLVNLRPLAHPSSGDLCKRYLMSCDNTPRAPGTVTVTLYAADDATFPTKRNLDLPTAQQIEGRKFYEIAAGVTLTVGELTEVTPVPAGGFVYVRVTASTIDGRVLLACAG